MSGNSLHICDRLTRVRTELHRLSQIKQFRDKTKRFRNQCNKLTSYKYNKSHKEPSQSFISKLESLEKNLEPLLEGCMKEEIDRFVKTVQCRDKPTF